MRKYVQSTFSSSRAGIALLLMLICSAGFLLLSIFDIPLLRQKEEKVVFIIDASLSMSVEDVRHQPGYLISRLDRAKRICKEILPEGSSVSIITYAKYPTLLSPFTEDTKNILQLLDVITPQRAGGGSDLALALNFAKSLYEKENLSLFILTDGGRTGEDVFPTIPSSWRIQIYGIGSTVGGKIPLGYNANGERYYKYYSGTELIVPYEKSAGETISESLNAKLIRIDTSDGPGFYSPSFFIRKNIFLLLILGLTIISISLHPFRRKIRIG